MKKIINFTKLGFILYLVFLLPQSVWAASVYLESNNKNISVGDTVIIKVKINSDQTAVNSVQGDLVLKSTTSSFIVEEFSLAGSIFGLWPRTPSLSADGKTISFVGGVPGGFNLQGATLFNLIIKANKPGLITIEPKNLLIFANNGKGTELPITSKGIQLNVKPAKDGEKVVNEWESLVSSDHTSPEDFIIVLGREASLFDGKKFAFFSAMDGQSGISHYEVSENDRPAVRSGSTYVLQDQDQINPKLVVTAYDKALNKKTVSYTAPKKDWLGFPTIFYIIVLVLVFIWLWRYFRSRRRTNKSNDL